MNQEILKRTKRTVNLKSGLDNTAYETRVYLQKVLVSLKKNMRRFFFNQRRTGNINDFVDEQNVLIDAHYFVTVRTVTNSLRTNVLRVVPMDHTEGRHVIRNGLSQDPRDRRGITSIERNGVVPPNVMALVFVQNYETSGPHEGHAICAFKHGNVLYCFNPWGSQYVLKNKHTGAVLPDNAIWEHLRARYRCDHAMVYTGTNFQARNTKGVCVGLSVDFGAYMYTHLLLAQMHQAAAVFPDVFSAINGVPGSRILFSHEYNGFVESLFSNYIGAFDNDNGTHCSTMLNHVFDRLTSNSVSSRTSSLNNGGYDTKRSVNIKRAIERLINQEPSFKQTMNTANWRQQKTDFVTNKQRIARANARKRLQAFDNRLLRYHGNTINAELRKFTAIS